MKQTHRIAIVLALFASGLVLTGRPATAADISGTIFSPLTLTQDSQLTGDVTCAVTGAPCISFGASGISLRLNGFSVTGGGDGLTGCSGSAVGTEIGIDVNNQRGVIVQGPGIVQRFRGHGIRLLSSTRVLVRLVTASTNCLSGLFVTSGSDNDLEANTSVRNGNVASPCGGI